MHLTFIGRLQALGIATALLGEPSISSDLHHQRWLHGQRVVEISPVRISKMLGDRHLLVLLDGRGEQGLHVIRFELEGWLNPDQLRSLAGWMLDGAELPDWVQAQCTAERIVQSVKRA